MLSSEWSYSGSAGMALTREESVDGRKILRSGGQRTHRVLTQEELAANKQARWLEMEVSGNVRVISKQIMEMRHLQALYLNHNLISSLPQKLLQLNHLNIMDLSHNKLEVIPKELGNMTSLLHLNFSHNQLKVLPAELGKLFKLKVLNVSNNPLPQEILDYGHSPSGTKKLLQHLLDGLAKNTKPPPPRKWFSIHHKDENRPVAEFTVFCYNVLCDKYATANLYSYCPRWALNWEYRKNAVIKEIATYNADIVALQEVQDEQFHVLFEPELKQHGYDGIFAPKSRSKTMGSEDRKGVDGCALFWKNDKFKLVKKHLVEFATIAINKAHKNEAIINRVMPKDNIALFAVLDVLPAVYRRRGGLPPFMTKRMDLPVEESLIQDSVVGTPLVLCAAHIHWDPEFCDVKLIQTMMLIHECAKVLEEVSAVSGLPFQEIPLVIAGDFNSLPGSGVIEYLTRAVINKTHPDLKSFRNEMVLNGINTNEYTDNNYTHSLRLESAIGQEHISNTNITVEFKGMIDYIFTTPQALIKTGYLLGLDQKWISENKIPGLPHPHVPSDHIPLLAQYQIQPHTHRAPAPEYSRLRRRSLSFSRDMEKVNKAN